MELVHVEEPLGRATSTTVRSDDRIMSNGEVSARLAYEKGKEALNQAVKYLAPERAQKALSPPKTMVDVLDVVVATQKARTRMTQSKSRAGDEVKFRVLLPIFQRLTDPIGQEHPDYPPLVWTLMKLVIDLAIEPFMDKITDAFYDALLEISLCLEPLRLEPLRRTNSNRDLVYQLYAAIVDFLVADTESSRVFAETSRVRLDLEQTLRADLPNPMMWAMAEMLGDPFLIIGTLNKWPEATDPARTETTLREYLIKLMANTRKNAGPTWIDKRNKDGQTVLHIAARRGYVSIVQWALGEGADVKILNSEGRTALFGAVEGRHESVARLLIEQGKEKGMEINQVDKGGKSALDVAVAIADGKGLSMVELLLDNQASPTDGVDDYILQLLSSAARGDLKTSIQLLVQGVAVESKDRFGYTALHEAVSFGHVNLVQCLIRQFKADINARDTVGGDTVLHALVERGCHYRKYFHRDTGRGLESLPKLGPDHVKVAALLLEHGVVATRTRWSDGRPPQDLVSDKLDELSTSLDDSEREALKGVLALLKNPPSRSSISRSTSPVKKVTIPTAEEKTKKICNQFDVLVLRNRAGVPQTFPVGRFIYDEDAEEVSAVEAPVPLTVPTTPHNIASGDSSRVTGRGNAGRTMSTTRTWTWVHLPANNKTWVRDTIRTFKARKKSIVKLEGADWSEMDDFIDTSFHEIRDSAPHARFRTPLSAPLSQLPSSNVSSLVIPYFDVEILESHCLERDNGGGHDLQSSTIDPTSRLRKWKDLRDIYKRSGDLYTPCSLDQSYYSFLRDSTPRDKTQIVVKYAQQKAKLEGSNHQSTKLLMVNQIWLWRLGPEMFITAFPNRRHENDKSEMVDLILETTGKDVPDNADLMILQILHHAIGFVDSPRVNAGLDENLFDIFEQSIAHRAHAESQCYQELHKAQIELRDLLNSDEVRDEKYWSKLDEKMCSIVNEVDHLREVKDILDELKMIERVLLDQQTVVLQYQASRSLDAWGANMHRVLQNLLDGLQIRIDKVQRLVRDAKAVEESLNDLLDLKQKQANLIEARDTRRLANEAENRAKAGEKQNKLIFLFTLVTVIFTPLSFASSLLAIPSQDYPQNSTGSGVGWNLWQVVVAILVTEVVGVLIPVAFMWLWMQEGRRTEVIKFYENSWYRLQEVKWINTSSFTKKETGNRSPNRANTGQSIRQDEEAGTQVVPR